MSASKFEWRKVVAYFREVSVVVIGVAVTLIAGHLIANRNNERDLRLYLDAVKLELEENLKILANEEAYLADWDRYAKYLASHNKSDIPADSIRRSGYPGIGAVPEIVFQTGAFEMFQTSGTMRLMKDKALMLSIWKTYNDLEVFKINFDEYYDLKKEEAKRRNEQMLAGEKLDSIPFYRFFYSYASFGLLEELRDVSTKLEETRSKL